MSVNFPFPGTVVTSIEMMSPPPPVQASPAATPTESFRSSRRCVKRGTPRCRTASRFETTIGLAALAERRKPVMDDRAKEMLFGATQYQKR